MNVIIALAGPAALVVLAVYLVRILTGDGYGTRPAPRSHPEEVGSWVEWELQR